MRSILSLILTLLTPILLSLLIGTANARADVQKIELKIGENIARADLLLAEGKKQKDGITILLHGTLAHKDMELIEGLQTRLAERDVSTLAINLTLGQTRREGMFDCTKPHQHQQEDALIELEDWINWLHNEGAKNISLLGHSRGGNQVALFANNQINSQKTAGKNTISKLILLAPAIAESKKTIASAYQAKFKQNLAPLLKKASDLKQAGKQNSLIEVPGFLYCGKTSASAASLLSYYAPAPEKGTKSLLKTTTIPTLIIVGSADKVIPDAKNKLSPFADGKMIRLEEIADAGHMFLDFYSEDAADLISEFLAE